MLFKIKKDLRSTIFQGNRTTTPPSYWALKIIVFVNWRINLIGRRILTLQTLKKTPMTVSIQLDGNFARDNQLTHGPPPSKISEKSIYEPKYSLKTHNGKLSFCKREWTIEEEGLPLSVRKTQKPQQQKEQRASYCEFSF